MSNHERVAIQHFGDDDDDFVVDDDDDDDDDDFVVVVDDFEGIYQSRTLGQA